MDKICEKRVDIFRRDQLQRVGFSLPAGSGYGFIVRQRGSLVKYALFSDVVPIWKLAEKAGRFDKILLILWGAWCIMGASLVQSTGRKE